MNPGGMDDGEDEMDEMDGMDGMDGMDEMNGMDEDGDRRAAGVGGPVVAGTRGDQKNNILLNYFIIK